MKMSPVVHFELPYDDRQRAADFYQKAFGWQAQLLGADMGDYAVVSTAETDPKTRMIKEPGSINGGLFKRTNPKQVPSVVISVDDIYKAMKEVKAAGGEVLGGSKGAEKPDDIPGVGLYASFIDTEGNRVGMLQPKGM